MGSFLLSSHWVSDFFVLSIAKHNLVVSEIPLLPLPPFSIPFGFFAVSLQLLLPQFLQFFQLGIIKLRKFIFSSVVLSIRQEAIGVILWEEGGLVACREILLEFLND
jgi:hypothetical protein